MAETAIDLNASRRMSEAEYEKHRAELKRQYGDSSAEAGAMRDQALAVLFYRSGWTQEELAKKEATTQQSVAYRLRFGRFLNFTTTVVNPELLPPILTERRFRYFWEQTDKQGNERARFSQVLRLMAEHAESEKLKRGISDSHRNLKLGDAIKEKFADGKWHPEDRIIRDIAPEASLSVQRTLHLMRQAKTYNSKCEHKKVGTATHWRIFPMNKTVSVTELTEKLGPLIDGLKAEGKKNMATMSPDTVARLAALIQRHIEEWSSK